MTVINLGMFEIKDVRRAVIDGRPQLVLDVTSVKSGEEMTVVLSRAMARELTEALGPHPLVEEFFADGEGLQ
jgi:hypothetical protein